MSNAENAAYRSQDTSHLVTRDRVVNLLTVTPRYHDAFFPQKGELLRNRSLSEARCCSYASY
ncbi:hypothetical protein FHT02_003672 [Sphingomonas xinjiangensis]|uniref:Uncharacterized protein n=1 Tax=Sphingomonas xinjiangensis TaxID=643568 RepID=A0A840YRW2_9SPHN|nr:hypothetical protein [Sphingomonas xinjiangensis]